MNTADREAFGLAIAMVRARGEADARWIDDRLQQDGLEAAGEMAAECCQSTTLKLAPWMPAPCSSLIRDGWDDILEDGDDGVLGHYAAAVLLRQMRALGHRAIPGLSPFCPDPRKAIAEADATLPYPAKRCGFFKLQCSGSDRVGAAR
jgi:hypothetical protein